MDSQSYEVFRTCAGLHLRRESELFAPQVVVSFTSGLPDLRQWDKLVAGEHRPQAILNLFHPAARKSVAQKADRFECSVRGNRQVLERFGSDVDGILNQWRRHHIAVLGVDMGGRP